MERMYTFEELEAMLRASGNESHKEYGPDEKLFFTLIRQGVTIVCVGAEQGRPTLKEGDSLLVKDGIVKNKPGVNSYTDPVKKVLRKYDIPMRILESSDEAVSLIRSFSAKHKISRGYAENGEIAVVVGPNKVYRDGSSFQETDAYNYSCSWEERITGGDIVIVLSHRNVTFFKIRGELFLKKIIVRKNFNPDLAASILESFLSDKSPIVHASDKIIATQLNQEEILFHAKGTLLDLTKHLDMGQLDLFLFQHAKEYRMSSFPTTGDAIFKLYEDSLNNIGVPISVLKRVIGYFPCTSKFGFFLAPNVLTGRWGIETLPFIQNSELFPILEPQGNPWPFELERSERILGDLFLSGRVHLWQEFLMDRKKTDR